jgi:hypothetical protein
MTAAAAAGEIPAEDAPPPGALYSFGTPWPEFNEGISYIDTFRCAGSLLLLPRLLQRFSASALFLRFF